MEQRAEELRVEILLFRRPRQHRGRSNRLSRKEKRKLLRPWQQLDIQTIQILYRHAADLILISTPAAYRFPQQRSCKLIEGLISCQEPTAALASALMTAFLKTRKATTRLKQGFTEHIWNACMLSLPLACCCQVILDSGFH